MRVTVMGDMILAKDLIEMISKLAIGRSKSFPCGWIEKDKLNSLIKNLRQTK